MRQVVARAVGLDGSPLEVRAGGPRWFDLVDLLFVGFNLVAYPGVSGGGPSGALTQRTGDGPAAWRALGFSARPESDSVVPWSATTTYRLRAQDASKDLGDVAIPRDQADIRGSERLRLAFSRGGSSLPSVALVQLDLVWFVDRQGTPLTLAAGATDLLRRQARRVNRLENADEAAAAGSSLASASSAADDLLEELARVAEGITAVAHAAAPFSLRRDLIPTPLRLTGLPRATALVRVLTTTDRRRLRDTVESYFRTLTREGDRRRVKELDRIERRARRLVVERYAVVGVGTDARATFRV